MDSTRPHIIPIGDKHTHSASEKCWCHPLDKDGVIVHNAKDCREVSERQNIETGKIWVEVLETYQRETKPCVQESDAERYIRAFIAAKDTAVVNMMTTARQIGSSDNGDFWKGVAQGLDVAITAISLDLPNSQDQERP